MAFLNKVSRLFQVQYLNKSCRRFHKRTQNKVLYEFDDAWKVKFSKILSQPNNVSKETWENIRNNIAQWNNDIQNNVDLYIFQFFNNNRCVDAGINYYKFLEDNNYDLPIMVLSQYLSLYQQKRLLTDVEKVHISNVCKKIMDQCKLLPGFVANTVVVSLCQIDEWEKAITVIKDFESHDSHFLRIAYNSLINYFLKNGNSTLVYKYLIAAMQKGIDLENSIYYNYLQYCLQERSTFNEKIEKLFLLWRKYGLKPTKDTVMQYIQACNYIGWSAQLTTISNLKCHNCQNELVETELSEKEFESIREIIAKNIITDNAYKISDPQELNIFTKFITKHKPYDFIVDGLNLLKVSVNKSRFKKVLVTLKKADKKVLVVSRYHLKKIIKELDLTDVADFFYVNNLSNDDAFILYATFTSGNGTNMISQDLMRQHKFTFNSIELEVLFKRWQIMHQYTISKCSNHLDKLHVVMPIDSYVQKNNNCWHIPYHYNSVKPLTKIHTCNSNWACFNMCT